MSLWAKATTGNETIMLDYQEGMNFYELLEAITIMRVKLHYVGAVHAIHLTNSGDAIDPEVVVPMPEKGKIGASSTNPYFFTISLRTKAGLSILS